MHSTLSTLHFPTLRLFASAKSWIEGEALRQLYATSKLGGMRLAVGFPDLRPGKGSAVGAAFVTEGLVYSYLIGGRDLLYEEAPAAYNNIEAVIQDLVDAGLVSVIATFRPLLTCKCRSKNAE